MSFFLALWVVSASAAPPKPPVLRRIEKSLEEVRARPQETRTILLRGADADELIQYLVDKERHHGARSAQVRLSGRRTFEVTATVDVRAYLLDKLDAEAEGLFGSSLRALLRDENDVQVGGYFLAVKGNGFYQTQWMKVNGRSIPESWIRKMTDLAGRHVKPPQDFNRLFPLPRGIDRVEIRRGEIEILLRGPRSL